MTIKPIVALPTVISESISNERTLSVMRLTTGEYLASLTTPHYSAVGNTPKEAIANLEIELWSHNEN